MLSSLSRLRVGLIAVLLMAGSMPTVIAQDLPACDPSLPASECQLPAWPEEALLDAPSPFGTVSGTAWLVDDAGDVGAAGLDVGAVGIGRVDIADAAALRRDSRVLRAGRRNQAVREGPNALVRIVLDRPIDEIADGYAGIHVASDIDGSRTNNAPAGAGRGAQPFAGSEDVYSVTYATTTGRTELHDSDLARGWFRDRDAFAAAWAAPNVLDVLIRPEGLGDDLRVVTFTSAAEGGYDSVDLGTGGVPTDGRVDLRPACLAAAITTEPFVVRRLIENGQTLRNVETPASLQAAAAFRLDGATRDALAAFVAAADDDDDGRALIETSVDLFEDGSVIRQRPDLEIAIDGDMAHVAVELGLAQRGFDVLRQLTPSATGDASVDTWLARASGALTEALPPFRVARRGGSLVGNLASCVPALVEPAVSEAAASSQPETSSAPEAG